MDGWLGCVSTGLGLLMNCCTASFSGLMEFSLFWTGNDPNCFGKLFSTIMALSSSNLVTVGWSFGAKALSDGFRPNPNLLGLFLLKKLALLTFLVVSNLLLVVLRGMFCLSVDI